MKKNKHQRPRDTRKRKPLQDGEPNWNQTCSLCGQAPTVHPTGLFGPCCTGEADTAGGNW